MVTIMKTFKFNGGWRYKNKGYIAKGWQDEPILAIGGACCEFYVDTTFYIGTKTELTKLWQKLKKDRSMFTPYYTPKFSNNVNYCIEVCKQDETGRHVPAMCFIHKVDEVSWDFFKEVTSFEQMKLDRQNLYLEWLQDHMAWETVQKGEKA